MNFLAFILTCWGLTAVITVSGVFKPVRAFTLIHWNWLGRLISCPQCTGFWVGLALGFFWPLNLPIPELLERVSQAAISSGIGLMGAAILLAAGWRTE